MTCKPNSTKYFLVCTFCDASLADFHVWSTLRDEFRWIFRHFYRRNEETDDVIYSATGNETVHYKTPHPQHLLVVDGTATVEKLVVVKTHCVLEFRYYNNWFCILLIYSRANTI